MKRQILNTTDNILLDAEKIVLMQVQQQDDIFYLNVTLDNAINLNIASFYDKDDVKEVFNGLTAYIWDKTEKNVYYIGNNDCLSKALNRIKAEEKAKKKVLVSA